MKQNNLLQNRSYFADTGVPQSSHGQVVEQLEGLDQTSSRIKPTCVPSSKLLKYQDKSSPPFRVGGRGSKQLSKAIEQSKQQQSVETEDLNFVFFRARNQPAKVVTVNDSIYVNLMIPSKHNRDLWDINRNCQLYPAKISELMPIQMKQEPGGWRVMTHQLRNNPTESKNSGGDDWDMISLESGSNVDERSSVSSDLFPLLRNHDILQNAQDTESIVPSSFIQPTGRNQLTAVRPKDNGDVSAEGDGKKHPRYQSTAAVTPKSVAASDFENYNEQPGLAEMNKRINSSTSPMVSMWPKTSEPYLLPPPAARTPSPVVMAMQQKLSSLNRTRLSPNLPLPHGQPQLHSKNAGQKKHSSDKLPSNAPPTSLLRWNSPSAGSSRKQHCSGDAVGQPSPKDCSDSESVGSGCSAAELPSSGSRKQVSFADDQGCKRGAVGELSPMLCSLETSSTASNPKFSTGCIGGSYGVANMSEGFADCAAESTPLSTDGADDYSDASEASAASDFNGLCAAGNKRLRSYSDFFAPPASESPVFSTSLKLSSSSVSSTSSSSSLSSSFASSDAPRWTSTQQQRELLPLVKCLESSNFSCLSPREGESSKSGDGFIYDSMASSSGSSRSAITIAGSNDGTAGIDRLVCQTLTTNRESDEYLADSKESSGCSTFESIASTGGLARASEAFSSPSASSTSTSSTVTPTSAQLSSLTDTLGCNFDSASRLASGLSAKLPVPFQLLHPFPTTSATIQIQMHQNFSVPSVVNDAAFFAGDVSNNGDEFFAGFVADAFGECIDPMLSPTEGHAPPDIEMRCAPSLTPSTDVESPESSQGTSTQQSVVSSQDTTTGCAKGNNNSPGWSQGTIGQQPYRDSAESSQRITSPHPVHEAPQQALFPVSDKGGETIFAAEVQVVDERCHDREIQPPIAAPVLLDCSSSVLAGNLIASESQSHRLVEFGECVLEAAQSNDQFNGPCSMSAYHVSVIGGSQRSASGDRKDASTIVESKPGDDCFDAFATDIGPPGAASCSSEDSNQREKAPENSKLSYGMLRETHPSGTAASDFISRPHTNIYSDAQGAAVSESTPDEKKTCVNEPIASFGCSGEDGAEPQEHLHVNTGSRCALVDVMEVSDREVAEKPKKMNGPSGEESGVPSVATGSAASVDDAERSTTLDESKGSTKLNRANAAKRSNKRAVQPQQDDKKRPRSREIIEATDRHSIDVREPTRDLGHVESASNRSVRVRKPVPIQKDCGLGSWPSRHQSAANGSWTLR